ncbi:TPA: hypothetical protein ENS27_11870 [bacterium]|nr:hypothetical protein [bacterium]
MLKADKVTIKISLAKSDYKTLQEIKEDMGICRDSDIVKIIVSEKCILYRIKKEQKPKLS